MKTMLRYSAAVGLLLVAFVAQADYLQTQNLFSATPPAEADTVVVLVPLSTDSSPAAPAVGSAEAQAFTGALGEQFEVLAPAGMNAKRLIALGVGDGAALQRADAESVGAALALHLATRPSSTVAVNTGLLPQNDSHSALVAAVAHGADLANYRFDRYKSAPEPRPAQTYHWLVSDPQAAEARYAQLRALAEGVFTPPPSQTMSGSVSSPSG